MTCQTCQELRDRIRDLEAINEEHRLIERAPKARDRAPDGGPRVKTVSVDFDGVLHTYAGWDGPEANGEPLEGAADALVALRTRAYRVVVHTCRPLPSVRAWLTRHGLDRFVDEVTRVKPIADAYFDDRGVHVPTNQPRGLLWAVEEWLLRTGQASPSRGQQSTEAAPSGSGKPDPSG